MSHVRSIALAVLLASAIACPATAQSAANPDCQPGWQSTTLACTLSVISWVEVTFESKEKILDTHKSDFEKFIRLRLKNELSMIPHETVSPIQAYEQAGKEWSSPELLKRGVFRCHVWTVGADFPVAYHVECKLDGLGVRDAPVFNEFKTAVLGYASRQRLKESVDEGIRDMVRNIAADLLDAKQKLSEPRKKTG